jgi:hypothetical protein
VPVLKPIIRCSSLGQLLSCHGSQTLRALVNSSEGDESYEGQYRHWETAWRIVNELGADQPEGGLQLPRVPAGYKAPKASEWLTGFFFNHAKHTYPEDWAMEVELPMSYEFPRFILSGHPDVHGVNLDATACRGSDWKCVYNAVPPAADNDQVLGYICLNARAYPNLSYQAFDIVQPRISEEDTGIPRVSTIELDRDMIQKCLHSLETRVNAALDTPMEIQTGLRQCSWCDAILQCPAIQRTLHEEMKMTLTPEMLAKIKKEPDDGLLGDMIIAANLLNRPIEDAKDIIKDRIAANGQVMSASGTRITAKTTKGSYKCLNPVEFFRTLKTIVTNEEIMAKALSYPGGRIKDAIAEDRDIKKTGKDGNNAEAIFNASLAPYCEQGTRTILQFD